MKRLLIALATLVVAVGSIAVLSHVAVDQYMMMAPGSSKSGSAAAPGRK